MNGFSYMDIEAFASKFYFDPNTGAPKRILLTPYGYPITFAALATGTPQTANLNISANADFILLGLNHHANTAAAQEVSTRTTPLVRILITEAGSGEQFTNAAVDLENYSSDASFLNPLVYPRILTGKSAVTMQVTNYGPDTLDGLELFLNGVQVRAY